MRILVIEEHARNREMLKELLSLYFPNFTIATVGDSQRGLELLHQFKPQFVVINYETREKRVIDYIKKNNLPIKIIALTLGNHKKPLTTLADCAICVKYPFFGLALKNGIQKLAGAFT